MAFRLFIAGHVVDVDPAQKNHHRDVMNATAAMFDGLDVVNPVALLDDTSDPKDVLCKYIRMMLDCTHIAELDDFQKYDDCRIITDIALTKGITIMRNGTLTHLQDVKHIIDGIKYASDCGFGDYCGVDSRELPVLFGKSAFVHFCRKITEFQYIDIAKWLGKEYKTMKVAKTKMSIYDGMYVGNYHKFEDWMHYQNRMEIFMKKK